MGRGRRVLSGPSVLAGLVVAASLLGAAVAQGRPADGGVLNRSDALDTTSDAGAGADVSSFTVTTYADQTVEFAVRFANRSQLHVGESLQVFVDLDDNGTEDLNLSLWAIGAPSYLDRWNGTGWDDVRQLAEAVQADGSVTIRLALSELRGAAGVPYGSRIGVAVASYTADPATGKLRDPADDVVPNSGSWFIHEIAPAPAPPVTAPATTPVQTAPAPATLKVGCVGHVLHAAATAAGGAKVAFYANGVLKSIDTTAPYTAAFSTRGLHVPLTIGATVTIGGKTQSLRKHAHLC